jgi:hypothetical protein
MISADHVGHVYGNPGRNGNVVRSLGVLSDQDIVAFQAEAPDLFVSGSGFHEGETGGDALVVVHVDVVAKANRPLLVARLLVHSAESDSGHPLERLSGHLVTSPRRL